MKDLKEMGEYKFRIKAMNALGQSDPLTGESFLAKNAFSKYRFTFVRQVSNCYHY